MGRSTYADAQDRTGRVFFPGGNGSSRELKVGFLKAAETVPAESVTSIGRLVEA